MFSLLSASHSISSHLAPENCKDLAFFLVNGFLKATPWFSSTVSADLMGYYSCSRTGNKNREGFESICVRRKKKQRHVWSRNEKKKKMRNMRACSHLCFSKSQWSALISMKNWVDRCTCFTCWASSSCWGRISHHLRACSACVFSAFISPENVLLAVFNQIL